MDTMDDNRNDAMAYQDSALQDVSRTFALTIPQLPEDLRDVVGNAYLLCRIADTIEDADSLSLEQKRRFGDWFVAAVERRGDAAAFATELAPLLGGRTTDAERDLVRNTPIVLRITHGFPEEDQAALRRCVSIMAAGMEDFQEGRFEHGLRDEAHLDAYCYHVAGVVGEMLTALFCAHSPRVACRRAQLERLAVSFGQGLQMTNILKDIWEDRGRNVCWLPQQTFARAGFDLRRLDDGPHDPAFHDGLGRLIGVARAHLENALEYSLLLPKSEPGIRKFCLWAVGMAVLTLRKVNRRRDFTSGSEVKISRRSVRATVLLTRVFGWSNGLLRFMFRVAASGLPRESPHPPADSPAERS